MQQSAGVEKIFYYGFVTWRGFW